MLLHTVTTELLLASELVLGLTAQLLLLIHMILPVKHMTLPVLGLTAHLMVLKHTTLPGLTAQLLHTTLLNLTAQLLRTALLNLTAQLPNITPLTLQLRQPLLLLLPILLFSPHFHTNFHHRPSTNGRSFHADTQAPARSYEIPHHQRGDQPPGRTPKVRGQAHERCPLKSRGQTQVCRPSKCRGQTPT